MSVAAPQQGKGAEFAQPAATRSPILALTANVCVAWSALAFLPKTTKSERRSERNQARLGPLRYAHFEVEVNADGFPVILGSGAMAVTYRARDTILNSTVALKVISRKLAEDPTARARFLREARAAAQIHHPNVARVIHYGEQDGECFYAMELVHGETLEARVRRKGPLPLSLALEVVEQTARGLTAGEECGVIHRDLKPSNLMIESHAGDQLLVKIIDYGVAKVMAAQPGTAYRTQAGFIGTPAFASPEQFDEAGHEQIDTRSDIYSLGVTFWYLLTAQMPFAGRSIEEIRAKQTEPLSLKQLNSAHVPHECATLLKSMLSLDPGERPQTARELLTKIHRCYLRFEPAARRRRKRLVLASVGIALAVALLLFANFLYQRTHSSSELDRSIAVLPFDNLSSNPDDQFFAIGIQDEILTKLASMADLKVISRISVMQYKTGAARNMREIGRQLGVAHVLEGSVQRSGNRVRINAQLIDTRTDAHLWAQIYDRNLVDVFAVQSEIAKTIADQLEAKISPNEKQAIERSPTADLAAFDLYTRANTLMLSYYGDVRAKYLQAIDLLNQAIARDPSFFLAYCQLAHAHDTLYFLGYDHTAERLKAAEAAVEGAFRLRPDAGEAHLARAENLYQGHLDYDGALAELAIARRTLPNHPRVFELTAYIAARQGKNEEWLANLKRAVELDPRNSFLLDQLAQLLLYMRRYAEAAAAAESASAIEPNNLQMKVVRGIIDLAWKADTRLLRQTLNSAGENTPGGWPMLMCALAERDAAAATQALTKSAERTWGFDAMQFSRSFGEGLIARMTNDEAKAKSAFLRARADQEEIVETQPNYGPALSVLALIDAGLGRKEEALREARHAIELMPVSKEHLNGAHVIELYAIVAAWVGEKDLACQQLAIALQYAIPLGYGQLKLLPFWDPLRGDPCFQKIVASLAPKD